MSPGQDRRRRSDAEDAVGNGSSSGNAPTVDRFDRDRANTTPRRSRCNNRTGKLVAFNQPSRTVIDQLNDDHTGNARLRPLGADGSRSVSGYLSDI
jgi:hypothetical protein